MPCKRGLCRHALYVRLSVCLSRSCILSKRINISSFFLRRVATPFQFFCTKRHGNIPTETSLTGTMNPGGAGKNHDFRPVTGFTACCERCDRLGFYRHGAARPCQVWQVVILTRNLLMAGNDDEMFTTRNRNVTPKQQNSI